MKKGKLFAGVLLFGSLWGFAECIIGSALRSANLPAGAIMTGVFAFGLMLLSRLLFKTKGMQLGMGVVAGLLRFFNPFGSCHICSAIAIMAEGLIFEAMWLALSSDSEERTYLVMKTSLGVVITYGVYVGGYVITQVLTPVFSTAGFYLADLLPFLPQIMASGLLAAVIGGVVSPLVYLLREFDVQKVKNSVYYPLTLALSALCWAVVIAI